MTSLPISPVAFFTPEVLRAIAELPPEMKYMGMMIAQALIKNYKVAFLGMDENVKTFLRRQKFGVDEINDGDGGTLISWVGQ